MKVTEIKEAAAILDQFLDEVKNERIEVEDISGKRVLLPVTAAVKTRISAARIILEAYIK